LFQEILPVLHICSRLTVSFVHHTFNSDCAAVQQRGKLRSCLLRYMPDLSTPNILDLNGIPGAALASSSRSILCYKYLSYLFCGSLTRVTSSPGPTRPSKAMSMNAYVKKICGKIHHYSIGHRQYWNSRCNTRHLQGRLR
jgi:hypothetical protein